MTLHEQVENALLMAPRWCPHCKQFSLLIAEMKEGLLGPSAGFQCMSCDLRLAVDVTIDKNRARFRWVGPRLDGGDTTEETRATSS